jgi:hypothetical protein
VKKGKAGNRQHNRLKCRRYFNHSVKAIKYGKMNLKQNFNMEIHDKNFRKYVREQNNIIKCS